jgi:hypothetical protein
LEPVADHSFRPQLPTLYRFHTTVRGARKDDVARVVLVWLPLGKAVVDLDLNNVWFDENYLRLRQFNLTRRRRSVLNDQGRRSTRLVTASRGENHEKENEASGARPSWRLRHEQFSAAAGGGHATRERSRC